MNLFTPAQLTLEYYLCSGLLPTDPYSLPIKQKDGSVKEIRIKVAAYWKHTKYQNLSKILQERTIPPHIRNFGKEHGRHWTNISRIEPEDRILTGPLPPIEKDPHPSIILNQNFSVSKYILEEIKKLNIHSTNFHSRTLNINNDADLAFCRKSFQIYPNSIKLPDGEQRFCGLVRASIVWSTHVGNCFEMAFSGLLAAWDAFPDIQVEMACIYPGDHTFLIIGRDPNSSISNYRSWGPNWVLCDPWAGRDMSGNQVEEHLYDYRFALNSNHFYTMPCVRRFNPKKQLLLCLHFLFDQKTKQAILEGRAEFLPALHIDVNDAASIGLIPPLESPPLPLTPKNNETENNKCIKDRSVWNDVYSLVRARVPTVLKVLIIAMLARQILGPLTSKML